MSVQTLRHEVSEFLNNENSDDLNDYFSESKWSTMLSYLIDIFIVLNDLNLSMQGKKFNIFGQSKKKNGFVQKKKYITIYKTIVEKGEILICFYYIANFCSKTTRCKDIYNDFQWISLFQLKSCYFNTVLEVFRISNFLVTKLMKMKLF